MRRSEVLSGVFAVMLVVVVAGCAPSQPPADDAAPQAVAEPEVAAEIEPETGRSPDPAELVGAWLLEDLGGGGVVDMVRTTLEFDAEGRAFGSGGCNRYTGSYTYEDGVLSFGPMAGTKMMCPEAVMDQEDRFLAALGSVGGVAIDGPFLLIFVEGADEPLRFSRTESETAG
jgi:heat shock protein HslJ